MEDNLSNNNDFLSTGAIHDSYFSCSSPAVYSPHSKDAT